LGRRGKEFGGLRQRRRVRVWGRGSRGIGCSSEKDLGRGTLAAQRGARVQFPEGLHKWDLRPFMGSMAKIAKISEDIKIKSALWRPF
jgi:hypothetical protein